jgi:hypothetical protein
MAGRICPGLVVVCPTHPTSNPNSSGRDGRLYQTPNNMVGELGGFVEYVSSLPLNEAAKSHDM